MPKLVIHIGRPKTGTTAFQRFLWQNRQQLAEHRVGYPEFSRYRNHVELAALDRPFDDRLNMRLLVRTEADRARLRRAVRADLERLGKIDSNVATIVTTEHLATNRHPGQVESFAELVDGTHDDVRIVAFVRRADHLATSYYSQRIKSGQQWKFDEDFVSWYWRAFDHRHVADRWREVFGADKVVFYPYLERFKTDYFSTAARIFEEMGIDTSPTDGWAWKAEAAKANQQLSAEAAVYLTELNPMVPPFRSDGTSNYAMRERLMGALIERLPGGPISIPGEVMAALDKAAPANEIVEYLGGPQGPQPELWQEWLDQPPAPTGELPQIDEAKLRELKAELFEPNGPITVGGKPLPEPAVKKLRRRTRKVLGIGRKPKSIADIEDSDE